MNSSYIMTDADVELEIGCSKQMNMSLLAGNMLLPGAEGGLHLLRASAVSVECNIPSNTPTLRATRRSRHSSCLFIHLSIRCLLNIPHTFPYLVYDTL